MTELLVICTANVCRSPMGAALLRRAIERRGLSGAWRVQSAGMWAGVGLAASENSVLEMADRGLDISGHRSQRVSRALLENAAAAIVMTRDHREAFAVKFPDLAHKVILLSELAGQKYDIADPIGQSRDAYAVCARELESLIEQGFDRLQEIVEEQRGD